MKLKLNRHKTHMNNVTKGIVYGIKNRRTGEIITTSTTRSRIMQKLQYMDNNKFTIVRVHI